MEQVDLIWKDMPVREGMIEKLEFEEYQKAAGISRSALLQIPRSPEHCLAYIQGIRQKPTKALTEGQITHHALLEPDWFVANAVLAPDLNKNTTIYKDFVKEQTALGKLIITPSQYTMLMGMIDSLNKPDRSTAKAALSNGTPEVSVFVRHPELNILCKCRPDFLTNIGIMSDLKTAEDAEYFAFQKSIGNYLLHYQAAFYLDVCKWAGIRVDDFIFVAIEKVPPYGVAVYSPGSLSIDEGRDAYMKHLRIAAACVQSNEWPGYPNEVQPIEAPYWVFKEQVFI